MKKLLLFIIMLIPCLLYSQTVGGSSGFRANDGELIKTYTNYTVASGDTTGWITINDELIRNRPLLASRLVLFALATDSVHADVFIIGRNNTHTLLTTNSLNVTGTSSTTYVDSIPLPGNKAYTASLPQMRMIQIIGDGVNRLPGCTQFRIATTFKNAPQQGTTIGRTLRWYVQWVR